MNAGYLGSARAKSRLVTVQIDKMGIMHLHIKRILSFEKRYNGLGLHAKKSIRLTGMKKCSQQRSPNLL